MNVACHEAFCLSERTNMNLVDEKASVLILWEAQGCLRCLFAEHQKYKSFISCCEHLSNSIYVQT